jgi:DNA polymerase I
MEQIFLLDAVNYLFRSYYAIGAMTNEQGESTNALYGFIRSVQKVIKEFHPDVLVAVFDGPDNKKSRQAVYAEYKMHRKGAPEDLYPQFVWAAEFCELAGIPVLAVEGVEADDTIASVASWAVEQGMQVRICSSDKDLMQLINEKILLLNVHKDNLLFDAKKVEEIYGVRPNQMRDLLALMGDASDNIPGLPGFGPKTAAALLREFGTLDALLAHPERVKGIQKQETLRKERKTALMSQQLASLRFDVPIPTHEEFYRLKNPKTEELEHFYREMNFLSLMREVPVTPRKRTLVERHLYQLVDDETTLHNLAARLQKSVELCIDTETTSAHPMKAELVGIGFCAQPGEAFYVPCNGQLGEETVTAWLKDFFAHYRGAVYGHNIKYDWHVLQTLGISLGNISFDTMLASYLLNPQRRKHGLNDLALELLQKKKVPIALLIGKGKEQKSMREVAIPSVSDYCCEDVDVTSQLKLLFTEALQERALTSLFKDLELPLLTILARMERHGIYLDAKQLSHYGEELSHEIHQLREKIFHLTGEEFNLNSPQQLSQMLFQKLGLPMPRHKKSETSTSALVLEHLAQDHPVASLILQYRVLEKMRSTYVEALPNEINVKTGRIHCTFNQSVTATGRLSCQTPNLQNIPVRGEHGTRIRACFKPDKQHWSFLAADYSQIELRLLAHFSEDEALISAFQKGEDIHAHTAARICNLPLNQVTPELRAQAKTVNFGVLYGQGSFALAQQTGMSLAQASEFIRTYFERFPRVEHFLEQCRQNVRKTGVSKTLFGRERPIPEIENKNPMIRAAAERLAVNTPLQGTAADLIKLAMIEIDQAIQERQLHGVMILQIHDELIFEVPDQELDTFKKMVKEKMSRIVRLNVPIEVSLSIGKNWGEC